MSTNELTALVNDYRELTRMKEELEAELESIKDRFKAEFDARNTDELSGSDWKATYKEITSIRLDNTALKKELPDVYARYSKESTCKRFNLK